MSLCNCNNRCKCTLIGLITSAVIGVLTAFFQITGAITLTPVFLWAALGVALVYLAVAVVTAGYGKDRDMEGCICQSLGLLLFGILGTDLLALILLAFGIVATSIISAILVGILLFFFSLMLTGAACFAKSLLQCGRQL